MAKGKFTATSASTVIIAANLYREYLCIQKVNATAIALGIGEAAVVDEGMQLLVAGDVVILRGAQARCAIYGLGNGATGTWQDGNVEVRPV